MAILLYVALDLSMPTMPGAFVFEPADSVESIGGGRAMARVAFLSMLAATPAPPSAQMHDDLPQRRPATCEVPLLGCPPARCLPRATCDPPQPSEDPH